MANPASDPSMSGSHQPFGKLEKFIKDYKAIAASVMSWVEGLEEAIVTNDNQTKHCTSLAQDRASQLAQSDRGRAAEITARLTSALRRKAVTQESVLRVAEHDAQNHLRQLTECFQSVVGSPPAPEQQQPFALPQSENSSGLRPFAGSSTIEGPSTSFTPTATATGQPAETSKRRLSTEASGPSKRVNVSANDIANDITNITSDDTSVATPAGHIHFDEVYQDGKAENKCHIVEHEAKFWILRCLQCPAADGDSFYFAHPSGMDKYVLNSAGSHNRVYHGQQQTHQYSIESFGVPVWGCTTAKATLNNRSIVKACEEQGYVCKTRKGSRPNRQLDMTPSAVTPGQQKKGSRHQSKSKSLKHSYFVDDEDFDDEDFVDNPIFEIPKPGYLYLVYWGEPVARHDYNNEEFWFAGLCLPIDPEEFESVGLPASLRGREDFTPLDEPPACYEVSAYGGRILGWASGYKDGEHLVGKRQYPFLFFDHDDIHDCDWAWVPVENIATFQQDGFGDKGLSCLEAYIRQHPGCPNPSPYLYMAATEARYQDNHARRRRNEQPGETESARPEPSATTTAIKSAGNGTHIKQAPSHMGVANRQPETRRDLYSFLSSHETGGSIVPRPSHDLSVPAQPLTMAPMRDVSGQGDGRRISGWQAVNGDARHASPAMYPAVGSLPHRVAIPSGSRRPGMESARSQQHNEPSNPAMPPPRASRETSTLTPSGPDGTRSSQNNREGNNPREPLARVLLREFMLGLKTKPSPE